MNLPADLAALLRGTSICYLATTMPDGSPQLTQTWGDTDDEHQLINTVQEFQKARNIERDPRVAVSSSDPSNPSLLRRARAGDQREPRRRHRAHGDPRPAVPRHPLPVVRRPPAGPAAAHDRGPEDPRRGMTTRQRLVQIH